MEINNEQLKRIPLPQFCGIYYISESGKVYSTKFGSYRLLKQTIMPKGYCAITVTIKRKGINFLVHRLVAITFIGEPQTKLTVNHKDGNKKNNHYKNLEWATQLENAQHARKMGLTIGVPHSEHTKEKLSKIHKNRAKIFLNSNAKSVINSDDNVVYSTAKEAAKIAGYNYSHFSEMLGGKIRNTSTFRYV